MGDIPWVNNEGPVIQDKTILKGIQIGKQRQPKDYSGRRAGELSEKRNLFFRDISPPAYRTGVCPRSDLTVDSS